MASIEIRRRVTRNDDEKSRQAFIMELEVTNAVDMQEEIFVFQRTTTTVQANQSIEPVDQFISIAEPTDLEDYPVNAPSLIDNMPFFLLPTLTVKFRSLVALDETWDYIMEDIKGLVDSLNTTLADPVTETVVFE